MSASSTSPPRRLGLFGGSFDPIHEGHLSAARAAQEAFGLDRVVFVPAARPPHKPDCVLAPGAERLEMVRLAIADEPTWCASGLELARAGPSFTLDTVRGLREDLGERPDALIWLLIGADNLPGLPGWRGAEELLAQVQPVVILREGGPTTLPASVVESLPAPLCERLRAGILRLPPAPGSSTDLRAALARGDARPEHLPAAVAAHIQARGLYRDEAPQG